mgnify:FL=1
MKLKFDPNQQYQLDAIDAVIDVFAGQRKIDGASFGGQEILGFDGQQLSLEAAVARGNILELADDQITRNTHRVQERNGLSRSQILEVGGTANGNLLKCGMNFSIEMETGTGKTYVYLRTIHELHEQYGWKKFIIVVPSVAIREGVLKNLEITREHFADLYRKPEMNYYVWDSKKTGQAREFATNATLQIMVITIDSFAKAANIMNKQSDYGRPLDFIRATSPVVIIDEPQNMETEVRKAAIESLNPLCTLRYSATHKNPYNLLYRLTPVDAYDKYLVKKIEVHSVLSEDSYNDAYVNVVKLERKGKSRIIAHVEVDASDEYGLQRRVVKVSPGDDLAELTGRAVYENYVVERIDFIEQAVEFANGKTVYVGQKDESLREEILKRQIELTIEDHFDKQKQLGTNVKVLSLFFIDKVANYREYTPGGVVKGKFAEWFEEIYQKVAAKPRFAGMLDGLAVEMVHDGYFAKDKIGQWKDSRDTKGEGGRTKDDDSAYNLIMKDKERLLDPNEPLRFIFSHSALREGWDNPNVFTICTLNETSSEMKKRQEIGRGLRLPVDINGERVHDQNTNVLTVVANESYADFSRKLQTEIEQETGISFSGRIKNRDDRRRIRLTKSLALSDDFKELWERIKHKTVYRVAFDVDELVRQATKQLVLVEVVRPQIVDTRVRIEQLGAERGFTVSETPGAGVAANIQKVYVPDILSVLEKRTGLTRAMIFAVLDKADVFGKLARNPQQMIDEAARAINRAKQEVMVDGISYQKTGESYDMCLFENHELEAYLYDAAMKSGAIAVDNPDKTIYDYVTVDSEVEYKFMKALEQAGNIRFYVKLPGWFTIPTPLGSYNPDWAVVFDGDERVYFVAETKGVNKINNSHLSASERGKILAARQHFVEVEVEYVAPVRDLQSALKKCDMKERKW